MKKTTRFFSRGMVVPMVLITGTILLLLGVTLHQFVQQQNTNIHLLANAEIAHFLAEAGISSCIRSVRESLKTSGISEGSSAKLRELLTKPAPLADTSLMSILDDTWNEDLNKFSKEVDKNASVRVEVWLRGFKQTETDPKSWIDPGAKTGWLSIESRGEYRGMKRVLTIKRKIWVGNVLPPVVSKFTLHAKNAGNGPVGRYNIIRNDYGGNVTEEAQPIVCYNHATPEVFNPFPPKPISTILEEEKDPNVYQKRGWIWLGGGPIRLHVTSGAGSFGEIFHFYDISLTNSFQAIKFKTPVAKLPPVFSQAQTLPWDIIDPLNPNDLKYFRYAFEHFFVIEGFHDMSDRKPHDAMYERNILSRTIELPKYGSRSSLLHLYGLAQKGFQSRTKVIGNVIAAFPRFAGLEIKPEDVEVQTRFASQTPAPLFLMPSLPSGAYKPDYNLQDFLGRRFGGPILATGFLFADQSEYAKFMSCIVEIPFVTSYNSMQDVLTATGPKCFPPTSAALAEDTGQNLTLKRNTLTIYQGPVDAPMLLPIIETRIQRQFQTIEEFWNAYYDKKTQKLTVNEIVKIQNPSKAIFYVPPNNIAYPLKVDGGGMVVLEEGNLVVREVNVSSPNEAVTIVLKKGTSVMFETSRVNHLNIVAPQADLSHGFKANLFGTLCLGNLSPDPRCPGGTLNYREDQDPTTDNYYKFYKVRINDHDTFWHE